MQAEIIPATYDHILAMSDRVRVADRQEIMASHMLTPAAAMEIALRYGQETYTFLVDGFPVCMFGIFGCSLLALPATPWMVTTNALENRKVASAFLRRCKTRMAEMLERYGVLENYVDVRNTRAIAWLKWLGFVFDDPHPYGVMQKPFHKFHMRRKPCAVQ